MINGVRKLIFNIIRRLCWSDYNANEDFGCMQCGKQILNRYLYCSNKCAHKSEEEMMKRINKNE